MRSQPKVPVSIVGSFLLILLCPFFFSFGADTGNHEKELELQSFYVASHVVSDAAPFRFEYILDVEPEDGAVLVRNIRIAPGSYGCHGSLSVKAADRRIAGSTAQKVARVDICSLNPAAVEAAVRRASRGMTSIDDSVRSTIVARCGTSEKVFELPFPESVDFKRLKRINPHIASLWDLAGDVSLRAFGKDFSFHKASASEDAGFRALGAVVVPSLKSGAYSQAFDKGDLEKLLADYLGPGEEIDPWQVELVSPGQSEWVRYPLPNYLPLAKQTRLQGEVRILASLDAQTGFVRSAKFTSGHPIFEALAVAAVERWQFRQTSPPRDSVEVTINFALRCH